MAWKWHFFFSSKWCDRNRKDAANFQIYQLLITPYSSESLPERSYQGPAMAMRGMNLSHIRHAIIFATLGTFGRQKD